MNDVDPLLKLIIQDVSQYRAALSKEMYDLHSLYNEITPMYKHSSESRFYISR